MYWRKRLDRENPDKEIEEKILEIRENNKDYGYRRMFGELRNQGYCINKKKVQRIMQKLGLQVTSFTRKSRKYSSYKGKSDNFPIPECALFLPHECHILPKKFNAVTSRLC